MLEKKLSEINYILEVVICHDYGDMEMVMIVTMNGYVGGNHGWYGDDAMTMMMVMMWRQDIFATLYPWV